MDDNRMRENSEVGSSSVQVLDSPGRESETVDTSEVPVVQENTGGEEDGDITNVQLVSDGLLIMDGQNVLASDGSEEAVVMLETGHIYVENDNERYSDQINDHSGEVVQEDDNVVPVEQSVASSAALVTADESVAPSDVNATEGEHSNERRNDELELGIEVVQVVENRVRDVDVQLQGDGSRSPDGENHFINAREVDVVVPYSAEEQNGELNIGQHDQELQVVPDSSTAVSSQRRFVSENLHEAMEVVASMDALEVQMVPTSSDLDGTAIVMNQEMVVQNEDQFERGRVNEPSEDVLLPESIQDPGNEVPVLHEVDDGQLSLVTAMTVEGQQAVPEIIETEPTPEQVENTVESIAEPTGTVSRQFQTAEDEQITSYLIEDQSGDVEVVHTDDHTYEVCVTMPDDQSENTVPFTIGDQVQEIPMELSDWANLGEQSLVAITEDGRTIPLTVIRQGPDGELVYQAEGNDVQLSSEILQQLANSHFLDGSVVDDGVREGQAVEVIEMLQSEDGTMILESSDVVASTSSQQIIYSESALAEGEQSILPDVMEDIASVFHIPENAYLSGQPFEVQFIDVTKGHVSQADEAPSRSLLKERRAIPRKKPAAQSPAPTIPSRITKPIVPRSTSINKVTEAKTSSKKIQQVAKVMIPVRSQDVKRAQEVIAQAKDGENDNDDQVVELSNTTPSVISPENMQALIHILQTLPLTTRGQTIQIILQSGPSNEDLQSDVDGSVPRRPSSPKTTVRIGDKNMVPIIKMVPSRSHNKTTTDIAIQVCPEFIDDAQMTSTIAPDVIETVAPTVSDEHATEKPAEAVVSEDDRSKAIVEAIMESSRKKRPYRKKNSKQIVTVEEQWVVDPKPGVSYYAVVDYLSEHDQDGFSSASEMKRPEAPSSEFMEDHLELQNMEDDFIKTRSVLESTIDSSVVISPFRRGRYRASYLPRIPNPTCIDLPTAFDQSSVTLQERTFEQAKLEEENLAVGPMPVAVHQRKRKNRVRHSVEHFDYKCGYCQFDSTDKILVVEHCIREHSDQPVKTLSLLPQTIGRTCPYCRQTFDHSEFFSHMRFAHNEVHPYKCGYCDFMGRDRNQIRHHIQKKHRLPMKVINLLDLTKKNEVNETTGRKRIMAVSEGEDTVYEYLTDEEELEDEDSDNTSARRGLICPECKKTFKTLKYLKTHIKVHQAHRYQCGYCDFISIMLHQVLRHCQKKHGDVDPKVLTKELEPEKNPIVSRDIDDIVKKVFSLNTRLPRDPDGSKWMRKWFCPHCDYTCQFGASYRRHLRMHANILPYKCNYCSFKGREKYYVRRHIHRMHTDLPVIVVENTPENCAGDTSSDEDFQEKGLRRKRRRRAKDSIHAVVPVEEIDPDAFQEQYQMQPIREMRIGRFASEDSQNVPPVKVARYDEEGRQNKAAVASSRLSRTKEWSGENMSDYIQEKEGDKIVCKVCGHKTLAKAFYKHARKHFKVKPFKCGYCNYMSIEKAKIRVHNTLKHPNLPFKVEECHLASLAPQDFMDLIGGEAAESPAASTSTANDPKFVCPLCQSLVDYDEKILSEHFYSHFEYYPYQCSECDHQNVSEEKVVEHAVTHGGTFAIYETGQSKPEGLEDTIQQFLKEGQELVQRKLLELMDQGTVGRSPAGTKEDTGSPTEKSPTHLFLCPICDRQMNLHGVTVRRHLYRHYSYKPFKCGHCSFLGASKGSIKKHTMTHGSVEPKIEITDELMPEDLAKMLREIHVQMKQLPHATPASRKSSGTDPTSTEGKIWHEMLSKNECPWCGVGLGASYNKLRDHVLGHFNNKPYRCGHCGEQFTRRNEVNQHIVKNHPNQDLKVNELDEESIRKGLRHYLNDKKMSKAVEETAESATDATPQSEDKADPQNEGVPEERKDDVKINENDNEKDVTVDKSAESPSLDEKNKVESSTDVYNFDDDDDADIVTVEGVLLTRNFRSETEASSDEEGRVSDSYSEDEEEEDVYNEDDFLVGDISTEFVQDIMNMLKKSSFTSPKESNASKSQQKLTCDECQRQFNKHQGLQAHITKVHSRPREERGPVFVCGYCEFCSKDEKDTETHMQENHADMPAICKKESVVQRRGIRRRGGARGQKRVPPWRRRDAPTKRVRTNTIGAKVVVAKVKETAEEEEEETLENITKMVQNSTPSIEQSAATDENPTVRRYELRGKAKCEDAAHNRETTKVRPSSPVFSEKAATNESEPATVEARVCEEATLEADRELHPLIPLVPNTEDGRMEALENLEECDENLPKILDILQLRPMRGEDEN